jgi:opacity protein-like surface antigen
MGSFKTFIATTGIALVLTAGTATAADMSDPFLEPLLPVEIGSAWYLRGDIGYKVYTSPNGTYTRSLTNIEDYTNVSLDEAFIIGGGFGYKFNQWFRSDVTIDYSTPANFSGRLVCTGPVCGSNYLDAKAQISTWTILANAYFDLGTWAGLTPYIGGGIGTANVRVKDYQHNNPPANPAGFRAIGSDNTDWNFAWALTAGASYDMTSNLLLDVNYRYASLGSVYTTDQVGRGIDIEDIDAHEFRVGVRFLID